MATPANPDFEVDEHSFINFFNSYMQNQEARHRETQENFVRMLGMLNTNAQSRDLEAPRAKTETEFLIESLSNSIESFSYDIESNSTFENWFGRYRDLFMEDAKNLDEKAKIRLLMRKLDTQAHSKFTNYILPSTSSDFSFAAIVQKLTKIFGRRDSLFYTRHKCFQIQKTDEISNLAYTGLVNKACEDFELSKLTSEQFKCLIYISGMKSKSDTDVRTKLLSKLDTEHDQITLERVADEYDRLMKGFCND